MPLIELNVDEKRKVRVCYPESCNPEQPLLILAHGASNGMDSPFMESICNHLSELGVNVVRFDFPYIVAERKSPDRSDALADAWNRALEWAATHLPHSSLFIGGKSMGGRIAAMIADGVPRLSGVAFLGYPLHPAGKFDHRRDEYLTGLRVPMLFLQGTRDAFARMDLLQDTLSGLREYATLHWVEGGDHSFKVLLRKGTHYPAVLQGVAETTAAWMREVSTAK